MLAEHWRRLRTHVRRPRAIFFHNILTLRTAMSASGVLSRIVRRRPESQYRHIGRRKL